MDAQREEGGKRSIIAAVIAAVVVVAVYLSAPVMPIVPQGIVLPINKTLPPVSPTQVTFYTANTVMPMAYERVGYINVQLHSQSPSEPSELQLKHYIQQLAANVGANGIVVTLFGHTLPNQVPTSQASYVFRGTAIYSVPTI